MDITNSGTVDGYFDGARSTKAHTFSKFLKVSSVLLIVVLYALFALFIVNQSKPGPVGQPLSGHINTSWEQLGKIYPGNVGNITRIQPGTKTQFETPRGSAFYVEFNGKYLFTVTVYHKGKHWFIQNDAPYGIKQKEPFWIDSEGNPYLLVGTFKQ